MKDEVKVKDQSHRFNFPSNPEYDLALLRETETRNPFSLPVNKRKPIWDEIAKALKESDLAMDVTSRACRERFTRLKKQFKSEEEVSVKASGVDEEGLTEKKDLLGKLTELEAVKPGKMKSLYNNGKRGQAEKMRDEAVSSIDCNVQEESDVEVLDSVQEVAASSSIPKDDKPPPKKLKKSDAMTYLYERNQAKTKLKEEELSIRKMEAVNRANELRMQQERQAGDQELRVVEIEEKKTMIELLTSLIQKK